MQKTELDDLTLVAFDTETSGAWPLGHDVVEFGAVKWFRGQEIDHLQVLIKPRQPMSDFIIGIHGISNEMVEDCLPFKDHAQKIKNFFEGSLALAHHAPFDLGFMAAQFESAGVELPQTPVLCTSLLARKLIVGTENHKLQTLVRHLGIDGGSAHRALDDARSCLKVALHCFGLMRPEATLERAFSIQEKKLDWNEYRILTSGNELLQMLSEAVISKCRLEFFYEPSKVSRQVVPYGVIRNPDSDYLQALCLRDRVVKRFYLQKISKAKILPGSDFNFDSI